jgi:O-antigen/teichoic acid export membrane protein
MIWAVVMLPALVFLRISGHANVFWFVFAWGAAAAVAAAAGPFQARVIPRLTRAREWLSQQRDLGVRYMAEGTASAASSQLRNYGVGLFLGLAAVGYVQAANTLMGPFMVILFGSGLVVLPEATKIWRRSPHRMPLLCFLISIGLVLLGLAWGLFLLLALPRGLGSALLGPIWRPTYPLVLPTALCIMASCATGGAGTGLHALGAARRSLRAALFTSAAFVVFAVAGAVLAGAVGCMYGTAIALWAGTTVYWWELRGAFRESGRAVLGDLIRLGRPGRKTGRHRAVRPQS